jgi:hypothetical protein
VRQDLNSDQLDETSIVNAYTRQLASQASTSLSQSSLTNQQTSINSEKENNSDTNYVKSESGNGLDDTTMNTKSDADFEDTQPLNTAKSDESNDMTLNRELVNYYENFIKKQMNDSKIHTDDQKDIENPNDKKAKNNTFSIR